MRHSMRLRKVEGWGPACEAFRNKGTEPVGDLPEPQDRLSRARRYLHGLYTGRQPVPAEMFKASELGQEYLQSVKVWRGFVPFLQLPPAARRVCYTTNSIEPVNAQLREAAGGRGKVPSYTAALKMLWVKICNIEDRCVAQRAKKANCDIECNGLIEGAKAIGWKQAINQMAVAYLD